LKTLSTCAAAGAALALLPAPAGASTGPQTWSQSGCGSCHTLRAAQSTGTNGPNLDVLHPSAAAVADQVTSGGGGMPSFGNSLSSSQIQALASWVSSVAGGSGASTTMPASTVRQIQKSLLRLGFFHGPVTGFYGPLTTAAVKRFQHAAGLKADGIWGPRSAAALKRRVH
jgi:mono/diheme cytochrome c family protein